MLTKIFFDTPPVFTPAVTTAFAHLGGLDLENPEAGYREYTGYAVKAPRTLSHEDVMTITKDVARLYGIVVEAPADIRDFRQVADAVRNVAEKMAGEQPGFSEGEQDFNPASANTSDLVIGLLTLCHDGNNIENAEQYR
jgi:hypothetical protein